MLSSQLPSVLRGSLAACMLSHTPRQQPHARIVALPTTLPQPGANRPRESPAAAGCACVPGSLNCYNLSRVEAYASNLCGQRAVASLQAHDADVPYFLYLPWQAVHHPHEAPPTWPEQNSDIGSYRGMLWGTDVYVGQLTQLLKDKGMYENTLIVFSSDNVRRS